jgi:hypothetical protein
VSADLDPLLLDSPAARPCVHPRARHQHGTRAAYKEDRCRCFPCRLAASQYLSARREAINYGRWNVWSDAEPVREYVVRLMAREGIGWQSVARRAGLAEQTVYRLLHGEPAQGRLPSVRVHRMTARKLYSVRAVSDDYSYGDSRE